MTTTIWLNGYKSANSYLNFKIIVILPKVEVADLMWLVHAAAFGPWWLTLVHLRVLDGIAVLDLPALVL